MYKQASDIREDAVQFCSPIRADNPQMDKATRDAVADASAHQARLAAAAGATRRSE